MPHIVVMIIVGLFLLITSCLKAQHSAPRVMVKGYYGIGQNYKKLLPPTDVWWTTNPAGPIPNKGYFVRHPQFKRVLQVSWQGDTNLVPKSTKGYYSIPRKKP